MYCPCLSLQDGAVVYYEGALRLSCIVPVYLYRTGLWCTMRGRCACHVLSVYISTGRAVGYYEGGLRLSCIVPVYLYRTGLWCTLGGH